MKRFDVEQNPFAMVNVVRKRAHAIEAGAPARVPVTLGRNTVAIAVDEIHAGRTIVPDTDAAKDDLARVAE